MSKKDSLICVATATQGRQQTNKLYALAAGTCWLSTDSVVRGWQLRRVLDQIRGRSYEEALMILEYMPYRACEPILRTLISVSASVAPLLHCLISASVRGLQLSYDPPRFTESALCRPPPMQRQIWA